MLEKEVSYQTGISKPTILGYIKNKIIDPKKVGYAYQFTDKDIDLLETVFKLSKMDLLKMIVMLMGKRYNAKELKKVANVSGVEL